MKQKTAGILAICFCLIAAGGAWWWLESATRPRESAAPNVDVAKPLPPGESAPLVSLPSTVSVASEAGAGSGQPETPMPGSDASDASVASGDAGTPTTVGEILAQPDDDYVRVAKKLSAVALDSTAPMAEREEALAHALNLSAGNEAAVLTPLVKDPKLPDSLAETVLAEALNRPLSYQADLYLEALSARKSPEMQKLIREHLAFLTGGEDRGENPAAWIEPLKAAKASWEQ